MVDKSQNERLRICDRFEKIQNAIKGLDTGLRISSINEFNLILQRINNFVASFQSLSPNIKKLLEAQEQPINRLKLKTISIRDKLQSPELTPVSKDLSKPSVIAAINPEQAKTLSKDKFGALGKNIASLTPDAFAQLRPVLFEDITVDMIKAITDKQLVKMTPEQVIKLNDILLGQTGSLSAQASAILSKIKDLKASAMAGGGKKRVMIGGAGAPGATAKTTVPPIIKLFVEQVLEKVKDDPSNPVYKYLVPSSPALGGLFGRTVKTEPVNLEGTILQDVIRKELATSKLAKEAKVFSNIGTL